MDKCISSSQLAIRLLRDANILVKDCAYKKAFEGKNYVRIAVRNRQENDRLVAALRALDIK